VVATSGNGANPGSLTQPLATIQRAIDLVQPGGTIAIRGGTYALTTNLQIVHSGTASAPIAMSSYQGEHVIIDGEALPATPAPLGGSIPRAQRGAIHQEASWWRLTGLEIINGPYGVYLFAGTPPSQPKFNPNEGRKPGEQGPGVPRRAPHARRPPRPRSSRAGACRMLPAVRSRPCACAHLERHRHGCLCSRARFERAILDTLYDENVRRRTVRSMRIFGLPRMTTRRIVI
jgi:hypothetical protein